MICLIQRRKLILIITTIIIIITTHKAQYLHLYRNHRKLKPFSRISRRTILLLYKFSKHTQTNQNTKEINTIRRKMPMKRMMILKGVGKKEKERKRDRDWINQISLLLSTTKIRLGRSRRNIRSSEPRKRRREPRSFKIYSSKNKQRNFKKDKKKEKFKGRNSFTWRRWRN